MTVPSTPEPTAPPAPEVPAPPVYVPPAGPVTFPLGWLLSNAAPPIQYRAMTEVARGGQEIAQQVASLPYSHRPALTLAMIQAPDGTWFDSMLTVPTKRGGEFEGVGTIHAFRRLLEYGWDKDSPSLLRARRVLFRLLAEDDDPAYLFELSDKTGSDPDAARRGRGVLREAAAAALAQAGYEGDPRLRGAARRITSRIADYLRSPLAEKPFVRVGNQHVLPAEAYPPSIFALIMLAHMPLFRNEHHDQLDRIFQWLSQPMPRQESVQMWGPKPVPAPYLILGDPLPHRNAADADVPFAILWLELMARLNFLRRNEGWSRLFERFLDDRNRDGVWHPHKGMVASTSDNPMVWSSYPLEASLTGEDRWTDITFRLGLIARLSGRPIELI